MLASRLASIHMYLLSSLRCKLKSMKEKNSSTLSLFMSLFTVRFQVYVAIDSNLSIQFASSFKLSKLSDNFYKFYSLPFFAVRNS